jgi:hypothetical protein
VLLKENTFLFFTNSPKNPFQAPCPPGPSVSYVRIALTLTVTMGPSRAPLAGGELFSLLI